MEQLPIRTNLVSQTTSTIKQWITGGVLRGTLPGEMRLKAQLGVGRDTLRLALKALAREGWITAPVKRRQRRVNVKHLPASPGRPQNRLPVTFLSPDPVATMATLLEIEQTRARLAQLGHELRFLAPPIFHLHTPDRELERLVRDNPSAAWLLYVVSAPVQRWFEKQNLPAFIFHCSPFPGVNLPYVVSDWDAAAFHAGLQLVRQKHRVVGIMEYRDRFPGVARVAQGLERALAMAGNNSRLISFKDDRTPASIARSLAAAFSLPDRPTALMITYSTQLLTCYPWLVARGIRVPGDVSLVSIVDDRWFGDLHPPICYYQPDLGLASKTIADRVVELVETGQVVSKSLRLRMEYARGGTIGPAPEGKMIPVMGGGGE